MRPGSRNRRVDRDLETICLKCLEKEPQRRYESAQALAADLERWVRGEPIEARASSVWQRLRKLVRRHPAMSSMVAAVVALAMAVATISTTAAIRLSDRGKSLQAAQADAKEKLRGAYLAQAQAGRFSGRAGRRFESLDALRKAAEIRSGIDLRSEAIACMALADIRPMRSWQFTHNIAFDCDLARCAMRDGGEDVLIKEVATDRVMGRLATKGFSPQEFSPDGAFLLLTDDNGGAQVWDLNQSSRIWPAPPLSQGVTEDELNDRWHVTWCRFTRTGACLMYGGHDQLLHFYDLRTKQERTIPISAQDAHINETGDKIAVRKDNDVGIYSAKDGSLLAVLPHKVGVLTWAWHPDGKRIATTSAPTPSDFAVHYWDVETQKELTGWSGHTGEVIGVAFEKSGRFLLSTSWDKTTRIWDAETRKELVRIDVGGNALRFSKKGDRFSFRRWDGDGFEIFEVATAAELRTLHGHHSGKGPYAASFHPTGRVLATISHDAVRIWDTESGLEIAMLPASTADPVLFVLFSPDGRNLFANGWRRSIDFGSSASDMELKIGGAEMVPQPRGLVYPIMGPQGYPSVIVSENGPRVVRLDDPGLQNGTQGTNHQSSLSRNGDWIATSQSGTVTIWDVRTSKPHRIVAGAGDAGTFSADGKWLMVLGQRNVRVLEVASGRLIPLFQRREAGGWSSDGSTVGIADSPRKFHLIDTHTWMEFASLEPPDRKPLNGVEFSPDGTQLVVASEANLIDVWDLSLIRQQLRELGLDWDLSPLPVRQRNAKPLRVTIAPEPGMSVP